MSRSVPRLLILIAIAVLPAAARAQDAQDTQQDARQEAQQDAQGTPVARPALDAEGAEARDPAQIEAEALFAAGREAADEGLWSEAVDRFERSYRLWPTASALYNLAVAERALGRHVTARDALSRLLAEHGDELTPAQRDEARSLLAAESLRAAVLTVVGMPERIRFELELDGEPREDTGERPVALELDPGDHRLVVRHQDFAPWTWEGTLVEGQRLRLEAELAPSATGDDERSESVLESPWLWVAAGVVVLGGAAAGVYFLVLQEDRIEPQSDRRYVL